MKLGAEALRAWCCALGLLWLGSVPTAVLADEPNGSAAQQLQRMAAAVSALSFEGTLVYSHGDRLETLYVNHSINDGQVHERLVSLTGPVRAVTRGEDEVTCILPNSHPISVKRHSVAQGLLRSQPLDPDQLAVYYELFPLGAARVAGRRTDVIGVIPRDQLRYGYRFYLDRETGLPLKTDLVGSDGEPIEQIMFTTVKLTATASLAAGAAEAASPRPVPDISDSPWRFDRLPSGFRLLMHQSADGDADAHAEHFVLSDGLAAISVYVEPVEPDGGIGLEGETRIGAIHAAGRRLAGNQVTVVGEVPAATVASVLAGIRFREQRSQP